MAGVAICCAIKSSLLMNPQPAPWIDQEIESTPFLNMWHHLPEAAFSRKYLSHLLCFLGLALPYV